MVGDNTAFIPQAWVNEALLVLEEQAVLPHLVHRDFENSVSSFGDVVNAGRPNDYEAIRKTPNGLITIQTSNSAKVPVPLDQWLHTSFEIGDEEHSKSFGQLVEKHLVPSMKAISNGIDSMLIGQAYNFFGNQVGHFGTAADRNLMTLIDEKFNENLAPADQRWAIVGSAAKKELLNDSNLVDANKTGDQGSALRTASLGSIFNMGIFMDQNIARISGGDTRVGAINNVAGYSSGSSVLTVDGFVGALPVGAWLRIVGDDRPIQILATVETAGDTTQITVSPSLDRAVIDNAIVTVQTPARINNAGGYTASFADPFAIDGLTIAPQKNQFVTNGLNSTKYGAFTPKPTTTAFSLSQLSANAFADNDIMGLAPAGNYNLACHKHALALVTRPLAVPPAMEGQIAVANHKGLSMRVTMNYDFNKKSTVVTLDLLAGSAVLDPRLGMLVLS